MKVLAFPAFKNRRSNPYNYLLYSAVRGMGIEVREFGIRTIFRERFDIIHIHWPEHYLNSHHRAKAWVFSFLFLAGLIVAKARGARIVWTVHNLHPHEVRYPVTSHFFWRSFLGLIDGYTSFSEAVRKAALATHPKLEKLPSAITRHGLYEGEYPPPNPPAEAAARLLVPQDRPLILFFGRVKAYKNAVGLIEAFVEMTKGGRAASLVVAGKIDANYASEVLRAVGEQTDIVVRDEFLEPDVIGDYLSVATLCVFPYKEILNSGSIFLSATYRTTALVPRSPNFEEYGDLMGPGSLLFFDERLNASDLSRAVDMAGAASFAVSDELNWKQIAHNTVKFFEAVASSSAENSKKELFV